MCGEDRATEWPDVIFALGVLVSIAVLALAGCATAAPTAPTAPTPRLVERVCLDQDAWSREMRRTDGIMLDYDRDWQRWAWHGRDPVTLEVAADGKLCQPRRLAPTLRMERRSSTRAEQEVPSPDRAVPCMSGMALEFLVGVA